jgi:ribosome-binding factor A
MDPISRARINDAVRDLLAELLQTRLQDPRLREVTVTGAEVTPDLALATVYFSVLGGDDRRRVAQRGLERASGLFRREIARRLRLRNAPELRYEFDDSLERGQRIETLLRQLNREGQTPPAAEGADGDGERHDA